VLELASGAIKPAPELASSIDSNYITGIGSAVERMLILIDIESLMASPEMGLVYSAG
jgi:purine-binding chemotaxis protein CheW